jgi:hypothetical protein
MSEKRDLLTCEQLCHGSTFFFGLVPMTEITVTPRIRDAVNKATEHPACDKSLQQTIQNLSEPESIPLDVLVSVSKLLVNEQDNGNVLGNGLSSKAYH